MMRTKPLWEYKIKRDLKEGKNVLVVAHANTLRGVAKIIDGEYFRVIYFHYLRKSQFLIFLI